MTSRGSVRLHSESLFLRNVRPKMQEERRDVDLEALACLLNFSMREESVPRKEGQIRTRGTSPEMTTVRTFATIPPASESKTPEMASVRTFTTTNTPKTPAAAPRPERPPG